MKKWSAEGRIVSRTVLWIALLAALGACASTQVQQVWRDDAYRGKRPQKLLVIAVVGNQTVRRTIESEFAKKFRDRGMSATESFRVSETNEIGSNEAREAILAKMQELGIEALVLTRTAGIRKESETIPGMTITRGVGLPTGSYGSWGGYSAVVASFPGPTAPTTQGYSHERKFLALDTQVYDVRTQDLIWALRTETRLNGAPQEEIGPYISLVVGRLFSQGPW